MRVLLTGASGFIGQHTLRALLGRGHQVTALDRGQHPLPGDLRGVRRLPYSIGSAHPLPPEALQADAVIHLAWPGLPHYRELFHIEDNLPASYGFLKSLVAGGVRRLLVAGTCLEYGPRSGRLSEDMPAAPEISYAIAKDSLHKFLRALQATMPFALQWIRIFYVHGAHQSPQSLGAQIEAALQRGATNFDMSPGDQLRDYLPVEEVARRLAIWTERQELEGTFNCCSGQPISIRAFAEGIVARSGGRLQLNLGRFPYPNYEELAFWGDPAKTEELFRQA